VNPQNVLEQPKRYLSAKVMRDKGNVFETTSAAAPATTTATATM
jgi:hypothetical protein